MFLTRNLSIKPNKKGFVYKCKLILCNLTFKTKVEWYFLQNGLQYRVCNSTWRNVATRTKQMSSEILSVSWITRRQFFKKKNPLTDFWAACCFSPLRAGKYFNRCWNIWIKINCLWCILSHCFSIYTTKTIIPLKAGWGKNVNYTVRVIISYPIG